MSRKLNIDLIVQNIKEWFKEKGITVILLMVLFILIHATMVQESMNERAKKDRINNIEERLIKQEQYMHQVQADLDNLYRWVEK